MEMTLDDATPAAAPEPAPAPTGKPSVRRATGKVRDRKTGQDRPRKSNAGRPPKAARAADDAADDGSVTPEGAAAIGSTVWNVLGPMFGCRALVKAESDQLGAALSPVLNKYLPMLGQWQAEVNLLLVLYSLSQITRVQPAPRDVTPPEEPETVTRFERDPMSGEQIEVPRDAVR